MESNDETDKLVVMPLGAGQEVGRSCCILSFKGKTILMDFGIHPGLRNKESLPFIDAVQDISSIDLILISHFHLDHCGGLPFLLLKSGVNAKCFMTHATKAIYRYLLADFIRISNNDSRCDQTLYSDADIITSLDYITPIDFHQEIEVHGIKFTAFHAGHVLGAAMFQIEIAGVKVLYTVDFSRQEDRHLLSAEIPPCRPDVLITESTYGIHIHDKQEEREFRFTKIVHDIISRGGRCLIPAFALGRAQELMLILDDYWSKNSELHDIPIYYASQLAKKCMAVYQTYIHAMNQKIRNQAMKNPFVFRHISNLKNLNNFNDDGPCVVMASPGMMQSGLSRELFENWCTDSRNGVIIAGYCVEGTLAKQILSLPQEIVTMSGQTLPLKCSVDYISFSAHTDYKQTSEFIRELKPSHVVLVHGEHNEMSRLCSALRREYEDLNEEVNMKKNKPDSETSSTTHMGNIDIQFYMPKNCEAVELKFRGERIAKVLGSLAKKKPVNNEKISGVLVKKNYSYHLMTPEELPTYTDLASISLSQSISIPFKGSLETLKFHLILLSGNIKVVRDKTSLKEFLIFNKITVTWKLGTVAITWQSNPTNDMYADSIQNLIMRIGAMHRSNHEERFDILETDKDVMRRNLCETFKDVFGPNIFDQAIPAQVPEGKVVDEVAPLEESKDTKAGLGDLTCDEIKEMPKKSDDDVIEFRVGENCVKFDLSNFTATCETNQKLAKLTQTVGLRLQNCLSNFESF